MTISGWSWLVVGWYGLQCGTRAEAGRRPAGHPDFPMPQTLRADQAGGRVIISCQVFAVDMVWQLAEAGAGTSIHVNVTAPESEAHQLDRQQQLVQKSLRRCRTRRLR